MVSICSDTKYTICTTGTLDTIGFLYSCCESLVASNDDFAGKVNFRIVQYLTAGKTYYIRVRAYGNNTGGYTLRVTERIFANYVTINKKTITLEQGKLYELPITPNYTYKGYNGAKRIPGFSVSLDPSNATEQMIWWYNSYGNVLKCETYWDDDGDRYFHVSTKEIGTAKLYAEDWNENGKRDECTVYVGGAPVTGITLNQNSKTISLGDSERLYATVYPSNAYNKNVTWSSSHWGIVDVDQDGVITGYATGTATITAKTADGSYSASCVVHVDSRPKVIVARDTESSYGGNNYYNIMFRDGKVWKNVGLDMSDSSRKEYYNTMYPPAMEWYNYDYLIIEEQRFLDNIKNKFTASELAYIYLFDPLAIEYYMRINAYEKDIKSGEFLTFKDDVYEAIFGTLERKTGRFYFTIVDGKPKYGTYSDCNRAGIYSNAEVLFGFHTIIDWDFSKFLKAFLEGLFGAFMENSVVGKVIQAYQILFHAGGILGVCSDKASSYVTDYTQESLETDIVERLKGKYGEKFAKNVKVTVHWAITLTTILFDSALGAVSIPNPHDITIYDKVKIQPNFLTIMEGFEGEVSMDDLINQVSKN